jgi:hypothetical protein
MKLVKLFTIQRERERERETRGEPPGGLREEKGLVRPTCKHAGATPLPYHMWRRLLGCELKGV